ncbi:uncharacterized protein [Venturia canescens]|uniref:uncharacterized protein n=1 Tax=Venturia canescens TaxID=32260 RepID=UPI001C9CE889|nr:uncharacterized protein LOC122408448 [Venturia canescens]
MYYPNEIAPKYIHAGHSFIFDKISACGQKKFWGCSFKSDGCKARLHTCVLTDEVLQSLNEHTHGANVAQIEVEKTKNILKRRAVYTVETPAQLITNSLAGTSTAVQGQLPSKNALRKIVARKRNTFHVVPPSPADLRSLEIPEMYKLESVPPHLNKTKVIMSAFDNLLIAQTAQLHQIRRVIPNHMRLGKEKFTASKTRTRISSLQELWSACCARDVLLQQKASEAQLDHEYFAKDEFLSAEHDFEEALDQLTDLLNQQEKPERPTPKISNSTMIGEVQGPSNFALLRITIPKFNGEPTKWESFRDSFKALVGENASLTSGQKLYYLKSFLEGNAAIMLEHISVSDANYAGAWQTLTDEYDNMRALVLAHIHAFASLPNMKLENKTELKRLRDTVNSSLNALKNLGRPIEHWDDLLVYLVSQKLSTRTRTEWNLSLGASNEFPSFQFLKDFLTERIRGIASIHLETANSSNRSNSSNKTNAKAAVHNTSQQQCPDCSGNHALASCPTWHKKSLEDRFATAKRARVCFNCLKPGHLPNQCQSQNRCKKCQKLHHTTLHRASLPRQASPTSSTIETPSEASTSAANVNLIPTKAASPPVIDPPADLKETSAETATINTTHELPNSILLATAWIKLRTPENRVVKVRALLHQGSTHSFVSEALAQHLRTSRHRANLNVTSFGDAFYGRATSRVNLTLESCHNQGTRLPMVAYVYQKITSYAARLSRRIGSWPHLKGLALADPDPSSKEKINALIGADLYGYLLLESLRKGPVGSPTAQLTTLGWIISGPANATRVTSQLDHSIMHCALATDDDALIRRFWDIEEIPTKQFLTPEEEECETHFLKTHSRDPSGRYLVRLPFRGNSVPDLGTSHQIALKRYTHHETRLKKKPELVNEYTGFLKEYESMGHMERVREPDVSINPVYIPHHPIIRASSTTTRVRVVFNASSITSIGTSLNDHLHIGPKLQSEIGGVLSRWRRHRFVYIADIEKMFRQILVHREDSDYQRIVFQPESDSPIQKYRLLTVTYGTACAPYLANRVLLQLTEDEGSAFPVAVDVIRNSTYVDDVLFGTDDLESARMIRQQLLSLLKRGGFHLRKWASNDVELLTGISTAGNDLAIDLSKDDSAVLKVLGITWLPKEDAFSFQFGEIPPTRSTKRSVLSLIARLFDPLGWASPVIINAKILMQDLWLAKIDWDDSVPPPLLEGWNTYRHDLPKLSKLRIPRWTYTTATREHCAIELHGFADASQRALSAAVYIRVLNSPTDISVSLLAAKSKVAPLKTVSIPRLELNGIVLLIRLLEYVKQQLNYDLISVHAWTDSTVALAWLTQHPSRWKPYVANRVSEIQTKMPEIKWHHVPTHDNPADCASQGIAVEELLHHPLWWSGPSWLRQNSAFWPNARPCALTNDLVHPQSVLQEQRSIAAIHVAQITEEWDLPLRFSSWGKLLRVTAFLFLWLRKYRARKLNQSAASTTLSSHAALPRSSPLKALNPFLDGNDQLRLGGRLRHSFLSYDERFSRILPRHRISELIIYQTHVRSLHGGTQLTLRLLRQNYWILEARSLVKSRINRCLACVRERAVTASQLMGDLPSPQVNPSPPFLHSDFEAPDYESVSASPPRKFPRYLLRVLSGCHAALAVASSKPSPGAVSPRDASASVGNHRNISAVKGHRPSSIV